MMDNSRDAQVGEGTIFVYDTYAYIFRVVRIDSRSKDAMTVATGDSDFRFRRRWFDRRKRSDAAVAARENFILRRHGANSVRSATGC
jgi:hypothetical protein